MFRVSNDHLRLMSCVLILLILISACYDSEDLNVTFQYGVNESSWSQLSEADCNLKKTICVSDKDSFLWALNSNYENIYFRPGVYQLGGVEINREVVISALHQNSVRLLGDTYLKILSDDVVVKGFEFVNGASPSGGLLSKERFGSIYINGNNVAIKNNHFYQVGVNSTVDDKTGISIQIKKSKDVTLTNNVFENSYAIAIKTDDYSSSVIVKSNDFVDSYYFGGAGEVIHFGDATSKSQGESSIIDDTYHEFSNNFVSNWNLEKELISIKSNKNKIYNNYFENNSYSAIVVRMGNENQIYNNIMVGNSIFPFRVSGERNLFLNNKVCGSGAVVSLHAEMVYSDFRPDLYNSYWAAKDNVFLNNHFYGYKKLAIIDEGDAAESDYLASYPDNNLFQGNVFMSKDYFDTNLVGTVLVNNSIVQDSSNCPFYSRHNSKEKK